MKPLQVTIGQPDGIDLEKLIAALEHGLGVTVTVGNGANGIPVGMLLLEPRDCHPA